MKTLLQKGFYGYSENDSYISVLLTNKGNFPFSKQHSTKNLTIYGNYLTTALSVLLIFLQIMDIMDITFR